MKIKKYIVSFILLIVISPLAFINCENSVTEEGLADLLYIGLSSGTITPDFDPDVTSYVATVPDSVDSLTVTVITRKNVSTLRVNDLDLISGEESEPIELIKGENELVFKVTGKDATVKSYIVTITRLTTSNNANLKSLSISDVTLSPSFNNQLFYYKASITDEVESVTVTAATENENATLTINGEVAMNGVGTDVPLTIGDNVITIGSVSEDGTISKTYTITITQAYRTGEARLSNLVISEGTLNPLFSQDTLSYTVQVGNDIASFIVTPTTVSPESLVTVNGASVSSGTASSAIALNPGDNTVTVVVTSEDGTNSMTYIITATRYILSGEARLSNLVISEGTLNPLFSQDTLSYTTQVGYETSSLSVTPTIVSINATVTIDGSPAVSGTASPSISLNTGENTITIVVTAEDGTTTQTYVITVNRQLPLANVNPDNLQVAAQEGTTVSLSWEAPADAPPGTVVGYNVYRSLQSGGPYDKINTTALIIGTTYDALGNQFVYNTIAPTYYYVVRAVDANQNESLSSSELSAFVKQKIYIPDNHYSNSRIIEIDAIPQTTWKSSADNGVPNFGLNGECDFDVRAIDFDKDGRIYFALNACMTGGLYRVNAITDDSATLVNTEFSMDSPVALAVDRVNNVVYLANTTKIYVSNLDGSSSNLVNLGAVTLNRVRSLAVDEDGTLYIGDGNSSSGGYIHKFNPITNSVTSFSEADAMGYAPTGIKISSDVLHVTDYTRDQVVEIKKADMTYQTTYGTSASIGELQDEIAYHFYGPWRIVGLLTGTFIIADHYTDVSYDYARLVSFDALDAPSSWTMYGSFGSGENQFNFKFTE